MKKYPILECMLLCNVENGKENYLEYLVVFNAKQFMKLKKGNVPQRRKGGSRKS